jgi:hypothetical protein
MRSSGSMPAQIGTLILATSGVQLANGFFNTLISLRVIIENFEATMAALCGRRHRSGPSAGLSADGPAGGSGARRVYVDALPGLRRPRA